MSLQAFQTTSAAHRKLPNELLSEIFIHCTSGIVMIPPERRDPFWTLLHVCSKWRQVILGTPNIWKQIKVDHSRARLGPTQFGHLSLLKAVLLRTDYSFTLDVGRVTAINPVEALIVPNIHRLKGLTLDSSEYVIDPLFELPPRAARVLEEVSIRVAGQNYIPLGPVTVLQDAPRLRRVTLRVSHFHPNIYRLPWAQLSDLHLPESSIHVEIGYAILSHCKSLERCTFRLKCDPVATPSPQTRPPLILRHLSSIIIYVEKCHNYGRFFKRFSFPRLSSFELIGQGALQQSWDPSLTPIITTSPFLHKLSLRLLIQPEDIEPLFEEAKSIVELSIPCGSSIPLSTLAKISRRALLPQLTSLTSRVHRNGLNFHLDMVEKRQNNKAHPQYAPASYIFNVHRNWRDDVEDFRLNMLREKGVNVVLRRI